VDNGARIISISWSYEIDPPGLEDMINAVWDAGLLIVASVGNDGSDTILYPAYYNNVIAVAGTESTDVKAANSNYGHWVDICAPYRSAAPNRDRPPLFEYYCYNENFSGTSASAPYVAGVAAMVWSCNLSATNAEVRDAILGTTDYIYDVPGNGPYYGKLGSGRVNAVRAVREFRPTPPPPGDANSDLTVNVGDVVYLVTYIYRAGRRPDPLLWGT
jgi:thermitase